MKLVCGVKNTGNGPAYRVTLWLLEYGHLTDLLDAEHYVAPLGPGEHYKGPHVLENDDRPFVSAEMSLGGREPAKRDDDSFRMLLRWEAMFWTYGESYVEEHYGSDKTKRPRVKVVYPWERIWRKCRGYDWTGRR